MEPLVYNEQEIELVVSRLKAILKPSLSRATILCLQGDLGAGKTTLTKALLRAYGVMEEVQSPTFVLAKWYTAEHTFTQIIHIDAYRIEDIEELSVLQFGDMIQSPETLIIIEWPEQITQAIPKTAHWFLLAHKDETTREIREKNG